MEAYFLWQGIRHTLVFFSFLSLSLYLSLSRVRSQIHGRAHIHARAHTHKGMDREAEGDR